MPAYYVDNSDKPGLKSGWTGVRGDIGSVNTSDSNIPTSKKLTDFVCGLMFMGFVYYYFKK